MTATASTMSPDRIGGLRRFAIAITALNVLGHTVLGFEQAPLHPLSALGTAYGMETFLEIIDARLNHRPARFAGGVRQAVDFLLSAHITGLAVAMLLYANDQVLPIVFAVAVAIGSKAIWRVQGRHFFNPSNIGISTTLFLFPWVGIAPPYHFTENLHGLGDWILPLIIVFSGTFLNARFTHRLPLIATWLAVFLLQAVVRSAFQELPFEAALLPMTGVSFILFTFYMITDPATTPDHLRGQIAFGAAVGAVYCLLMLLHVVFGLFFALTIVCAGRGAELYYAMFARRVRLSVSILSSRDEPAPGIARVRGV
jgi:enediyne biosynthesis protein E5